MFLRWEFTNERNQEQTNKSRRISKKGSVLKPDLDLLGNSKGDNSKKSKKQSNKPKTKNKKEAKNVSKFSYKKIHLSNGGKKEMVTVEDKNSKLLDEYRKAIKEKKVPSKKGKSKKQSKRQMDKIDNFLKSKIEKSANQENERSKIDQEKLHRLTQNKILRQEDEYQSQTKISYSDSKQNTISKKNPQNAENGNKVSKKVIA